MVEVRRRSGSKQIGAVALSSILLCLLGLGQLGLGIWLIYYFRQLSLILSPPIINVHYGYAVNGLVSSAIGVLGCVGSLWRKRNCLFVYAVLLLLSMICQIGVWAFIYVERPKVSSVLAYTIVSSPEIEEFVMARYECQLYNMTDSSIEDELLECSDLVDSQIWSKLLAELALCGVIIALQFVLIIMVLMLSKLIYDDDIYEDVRVHPLSSLSQRRHQAASGTDTLSEEDGVSPSMSPRLIHVSPRHYTTDTISTSVPSAPVSPRSSNGFSFHNPMFYSSGWASTISIEAKPINMNTTTTTML